MRTLETVMSSIDEIVEKYESGEWLVEGKLADLHKSLAINVYFLTKFQIEANKKFNGLVYSSEATSVARARAEAEEQVPELYQCRKIIEALKNISISMTHELNILKQER